MSETVTNGACYCGAVKVTAVGDPKAVLVCHCRDCARWFGSLNMATLFERDKVTVTGETVEVTNAPRGQGAGLVPHHLRQVQG